MANADGYFALQVFEELGVPLKIERGNRVFPQSDKAVDIVDAPYVHALPAVIGRTQQNPY